MSSISTKINERIKKQFPNAVIDKRTGNGLKVQKPNKFPKIITIHGNNSYINFREIENFENFVEGFKHVGIDSTELPQKFQSVDTELGNYIKLILNTEFDLNSILTNNEKNQIVNQLMKNKKISPIIYLLFALLTNYQENCYFMKVTTFNNNSTNVQELFNIIDQKKDSIICCVVDYFGTTYFGIYNGAQEFVNDANWNAFTTDYYLANPVN